MNFNQTNSHPSISKKANLSSNRTVSATTKKVLFVCYGNICRSPSAQGIFDFLAAINTGATTFETDSAGTHDFHIGKAPDARAINALANAGLDISDLKGRQLTVEDFYEFDHIIVMDQRNLDFVSAICPTQHFHKVSLITDFAGDSDLTTIPDPFHGDEEDFEIMVNQLFAVCKSLLEGLCVTNSILPISHKEKMSCAV